jgi:hypothetical protein
VVEAAWLEDELAELERLVEGGETLEAVSRLATMSRAPRYAERPTQSSRTRCTRRMDCPQRGLELISKRPYEDDDHP